MLTAIDRVVLRRVLRRLAASWRVELVAFLCPCGVPAPDCPSHSSSGPSWLRPSTGQGQPHDPEVALRLLDRALRGGNAFSAVYLMRHGWQPIVRVRCTEPLVPVVLPGPKETV